MNDPALVFLAAARNADLRKWAHSPASVQHLPPKVCLCFSLAPTGPCMCRVSPSQPFYSFVMRSDSWSFINEHTSMHAVPQSTGGCFVRDWTRMELASML